MAVTWSDLADSERAVRVAPGVASWADRSPRPVQGAEGAEVAHEVVAEMVANVLTLVAEPGSVLEAGDTILILESMKMEIPVISEHTGTVSAVKVAVGDVVQEGDPLVELTA